MQNLRPSTDLLEGNSLLVVQKGEQDTVFEKQYAGMETLDVDNGASLGQGETVEEGDTRINNKRVASPSDTRRGARSAKDFFAVHSEADLPISQEYVVGGVQGKNVLRCAMC